MRFLVLGASGRMGNAICRQLSKVGDVRGFDKAAFDWPQRADPEGKYEDYDCVVSALPVRENVCQSAMVASRGVPWVDLGGSDDVTAQQWLAIKGSRAMAPVIPNCGLAPGLVPMIGAALATHATPDRHWLKLLCGGISQQPDGKLGWVRTWSPQGLVEEYTAIPTVLKSGAVLRALDLPVTEFLWGSIELEQRQTAGNIGTLPFVLANDALCLVDNAEYYTLRHLGHYELVSRWIDELGPERAARMVEESASPGPDMVLYGAQLYGPAIGATAVHGIILPTDGMSAMAYATSAGIAAVAMMAPEVGHSGFVPVETLDFTRIVRNLKLLGFPVTSFSDLAPHA